MPDEPGATRPSLRQRAGDQPLPVRNDSRDIQSMVIDDIRGRRELGIRRYGTALQPNNGRDALRDLYEELLDAVMYVRQVMAERGASGVLAIAAEFDRKADETFAEATAHAARGDDDAVLMASAASDAWRAAARMARKP